MPEIEQLVRDYSSEMTIKLAAIWLVMMIVLAACVFVTPNMTLRETMAFALIALLFSACMAAARRGNNIEYELLLRKTSP
jgi:hypothetical protein